MTEKVTSILISDKAQSKIIRLCLAAEPYFGRERASTSVENGKINQRLKKRSRIKSWIS